jgi:RimJ/RimL family protein N-acetyltransferase
VTPILRTNRLRLREWRLTDLEDAFRIWGDPEVVRFLGKQKVVRDLDEQREWLMPRIERWSRPEWYERYDIWAIALPDTDRVIGTIFLKPFDNRLHERIEIGWHFASAFWRQGFATEAAREVLRYAFDVRRHARIEALVLSDNLASIRLATRLGMTNVGRTTEAYEEELELFVIERPPT